MEIDALNNEQTTLISIIKPEGKKILEIGCGTGRQALFLAETTDTYVAIDPNHEAIDIAIKNVPQKIKNKVRFDVGYAEKLNFPSNQFDTVIMIMSFHEMPLQNQGIIIGEISRVLKDKGQLLIVDPSEPPGVFQKCFNIIHEEFRLYNHSFGVIHSNWLIEKAVQQGLFAMSRKLKYIVDYSFNNIAEFIKYLMDDFYGEIDWDISKQEILKSKIKEQLKIGNEEDRITLVDEVSVLDLFVSK